MNLYPKRRRASEIRDYNHPYSARAKELQDAGKELPFVYRLVRCRIHCGKIATKEAIIKEDGIAIIERYCDTCLKVYLVV